MAHPAHSPVMGKKSDAYDAELAQIQLAIVQTLSLIHI